jgi:hypothetical protein
MATLISLLGYSASYGGVNGLVSQGMREAFLDKYFNGLGEREKIAALNATSAFITSGLFYLMPIARGFAQLSSISGFAVKNLVILPIAVAIYAVWADKLVTKWLNYWTGNEQLASRIKQGAFGALGCLTVYLAEMSTIYYYQLVI